MNKHEKFLQFNGQNIVLLDVNGTYWVAIKPICEALGVNYNRQFQNLKESKIYSQLFAKQQTVAADNRMRNMVCLPERYIYGWLLQINSSNDELISYQLKCHDVLFDHFHGAITNRKELLLERQDLANQIKEAELELKTNEKVQKLQILKSRKAQLSKALTESDKEIIQQSSLLDQNEFNA
jgi:hypothetical protein